MFHQWNKGGAKVNTLIHLAVTRLQLAAFAKQSPSVRSAERLEINNQVRADINTHSHKALTFTAIVIFVAKKNWFMITSRIRSTENLHILLWLIKDTCWVQDYRIAGLIMIIPTISVAVLLTLRTKRVREEFIHNLAIVFWLCANSVWMIGEFFFDDTTRTYAVVFFGLGLITLAVHYIPKWTGLHKTGSVK